MHLHHKGADSLKRNACRDLKALHEQLVVGGIISEAEFWRHRQHLLRQQAQDQMQSKQKPGLSNAMIEQSIDPSSNKASLQSGLSGRLLA